MDYLKKITIHFLLLIAFSIFRYQIAFAEAGELILLPEIKHDGLTFDRPLDIENTNDQAFKPLRIEFGEQVKQVDEKAPTPTITSKSTPTPTPKATAIQPTPTFAPAPTIQPIQSVQTGSNTSNGGLNAELLFNMSNDYRAGRGLPAFQKNERICSLAASRAPEIAAEIAGGYMHAGFRSRGVPGSENIITMRSEQEAFSWWVNDPPHLAAIIGNYTYSCVACAGNACTQEFSNL